jgi:hypothetical protein
LLSTKRWPFEFDDITLWIREVDRWTLSFGAVARFHWPYDYSMRFKHAANTAFVERLYPKAKVIKVAAFKAGRRATSPPRLAPDRHKVNQGSASPKLDETYRILSALDRASKHITVKVKHSVQIDHAQHQVINFANANHRSILVENVVTRSIRGV